MQSPSPNAAMMSLEAVSGEQALSRMRLERRAKLAALCYLPGFYYCVVAWQQSAWYTLAGTFFCLACALLSEYFARVLHREKAAMYCFITGFYGLEGLGALGDGLLDSHCLWLISMGPILGTVLLGARAAMVCLAVSIGFILALWGLGLGFTFSHQFVHNDASLYVFRIVCLLQYAGFAWIWTKQLRRHVQEMYEHNQELAVAKDNLEEAHRSKSTFLATMSHEIRTPMNGILGTAQCLAMGELAAEKRSWIQIILDSGQHLMDVLNAILDLSKIDAHKLEPRTVDFRLDRVFNDTMTQMSHSLDAQQVSLQFKKNEVPLLIQGDPDRIEQVLRSLFTTMIEYSNGTRMNVELLREQSYPTIQISMPELELDARSLEVLQDPQSELTQDNDEHSRVALGMKLSHAMIALMGGRLDITSNRTEGTQLHWRLDALIKEIDLGESHLLAQTADSTDEHFEGLSILVTDDNAVNRRVAKIQLEKLGCVVTAATNGIEAIDVCRSKSFDLILMDLHMPECDGMQASHAIRNTIPRHADTPILAFTADAYDVDRERLNEAGMCDHLPKPFRLELVRRALRRYAKPPIGLHKSA